MTGLRWCSCLCLLAVLAGCNPPKERPKLTVHPVSGTVLCAGKPAQRAEVTLRPLAPLNEPTGRSVVPVGIVQPDGSFRIGTYTDDDGAPAGEYAITIVWPLVTVEGGEENIGADQLRGAYRDPTKPVAKITVAAGENKIPPIQVRLP